MSKFSDKTPQEQFEHIESLIRWGMIGAYIDYNEEEFNAGTKLQKDKLICISIKRLRPFELAYIRDNKIDDVLK